MTPSGWTLRTRLVAALTAVTLLVCAVVATVTLLALHNSLTNQLDHQLDAAVLRTQSAEGPDPIRRRPPDQPGPPGFLSGPGAGVGTLGARLVDGTVSGAGIVDSSGHVLELSSATAAALTRLPVDHHPHTLDLAGLGSYRLVAARASDGDVLVTGLSLEPANHTVMQVAGVVAGVAALGLLAAFLAGATIVRRSLRPLNRVAATATRVAQLPLHEGEVALSERVPAVDTDPRTEVGRVGAALNLMLGHVAAALAARHQSETRVRQFVADASHELRTPLAAIRGYAEVTRRGHEEVPDDVAYAIGRVESEAARMTALVDDLLLLARLDAGRPLARDQVDVSCLLVDAVNDARVAGPDHRWELRLPAEALVVTGDQHRLHQVLANLLTNARTHTPPGTRVVVSLARTGTRVRISVCDGGPGIPTELLPVVFERFARGDTSRSRAAGSTGLGLAIVSAVTEAHHGQVRVDSEAGRTEFTLELPVRPPLESHSPATAGR
nr:HAMP domain-containing sensor histidine kinase [Actinopolymorpha rutila]